jgi:hypothetical protein
LFQTSEHDHDGQRWNDSKTVSEFEWRNGLFQ